MQRFVGRCELSELFGDLPACECACEGSVCGRLAGGGACHGGEGCLDFWCFGPDGDVLQGVAIGYLGFGEAVGLGGWGEAVDGGDGAVAVAEAGGETSASGGDGVAADVDGGLLRDGEELGFDERVELLYLNLVGGADGEARRIGEEAFVMGGEAGIEAGDEVLGGGFGLSAAAGDEQNEQGGRCEVPGAY